MIYLISFISLAVVSFGILYSKKTIKNFYNKSLLFYSLYKNLNITQQPDSKPSESIIINSNSDSAAISYTYFGKSYKVYIPYCMRYVPYMAQFNVILNMENGENINITQQPGIPYMISADNLGGKSITIYNYDNDNQYVYEKNIMPMYGLELLN